MKLLHRNLADPRARLGGAGRLGRLRRMLWDNTDRELIQETETLEQRVPLLLKVDTIFNRLTNIDWVAKALLFTGILGTLLSPRFPKLCEIQLPSPGQHNVTDKVTTVIGAAVISTHSVLCTLHVFSHLFLTTVLAGRGERGGGGNVFCAIFKTRKWP